MKLATQFKLGLCLIMVQLCFFDLQAFSPLNPTSESVPDWIWHPETKGNFDRPPAEQIAHHVFTKEFAVDKPTRIVKLCCAADFCNLTLSINGQTCVTIEPYSPTVNIDVSAFMRPGPNSIRIDAQAVPGPAAIAMGLQIYTADDPSPHSIVSDESWSASVAGTGVDEANKVARQARSAGRVSQDLWGTGRRGIHVDATENYEQWRQAETGRTTDAKQFWTVPGFHVTLVRDALPEEGSWTSMAFDSKGRLTLAKEDKGLLRFTLDESKRSVVKVESLVDELLECRGMVYAHDALYVNANNSKAMYRLRDTNGDDKLDEVKLLRKFPGSVGHGRNDLALASDGSIHSIHGDSVEIPDDDVIDRTSPLRESRNGEDSQEGHVIRTNPEGTKWELQSAGLRNPFGLAANADGEWFTYDADAEFDMGSPWYRPTRILHLVAGADFGWRGVTGKWPPYFPDHPDNAMPTLDIGRGSPTAVLFGTESHFPSNYRRSLFVLDWTYGRILSIHLAPRGASYRAQAETFLQGRPLNVTDLAIGPDGAMYVITGGRKTQSALYRIAYDGDATNETPVSKHEQESIANAAIARRLRTELEQGDEQADQSFALAWDQLDSPDWAIRYAARIAIEKVPVEQWRDDALRETRPRAAVEAMMALIGVRDTTNSTAIVDRLLRLSVDEMQLGQVWGVLYCYAMLYHDAAEGLQPKRSEIIAQVESLYLKVNTKFVQVCRCGTDAEARREAARLLSLLEAESLVDIVAPSLLESDSQEDQLQGLFVLRNARQGWTLDRRTLYFKLLHEASRFVGGEGMPTFLSKIREESLATLSEQERVDLADLLNANANEDEPLPAPRPHVRQWTAAAIVDLLTSSEHKANRERGETVFRDALCSRCHRSGARGPAVGPDLTHVASRFSRQDMIDSIVEPSRVVAENYRNVQIAMADGRTVVGRLAIQGDYRSQSLQVATDSMRPSDLIEIRKQDIDSLRESPVSPMPAGLLDTFSAEEILDLLEYLANPSRVSSSTD